MQHTTTTIRSPLPGRLVQPEAKVRQRPETASPTAQGGGGRRRIRWRAATSCESLAPVARGHEGPNADARRIRSIRKTRTRIVKFSFKRYCHCIVVLATVEFLEQSFGQHFSTRLRAIFGCPMQCMSHFINSFFLLFQDETTNMEPSHFTYLPIVHVDRNLIQIAAVDLPRRAQS